MAKIIREQWCFPKGAGTKSSGCYGYRRILFGTNKNQTRRRGIREIQSCQEGTVSTAGEYSLLRKATYLFT
jgi:hypothetical protein